MRAFQAAKDHFKGKSSVGDDYVQMNEFRLFLLYLRQYFEYFVMFNKIDTSDDNCLSIEEFKKALPTMKKWGLEITDPDAEFADMDENGGGKVLFDEFSEYCIKKSLDLENDGGSDNEEEAV